MATSSKEHHLEMKKNKLFGSAPRMSETVHVIVVGDFGRDASIRFCQLLSEAERALLRASSESEKFYDESRRTTLSLVGHLPFIKDPYLDKFREDSRHLDDSILSGFPGGPSPEFLACRIGYLVFLELIQALRLRISNVIIALPCNTLAPVSWLLQHGFGSPESLLHLFDDLPFPLENHEHEQIERILASMNLSFPTVPSMVLKNLALQNVNDILLLGTLGIRSVYEKEVLKNSLPVTLIEVEESIQKQFLSQIQASIQGDKESVLLAKKSAQDTITHIRTVHGRSFVAVEACTDLFLGVGLNSNMAYAEGVLAEVYGQSYLTKAGD
jgi:hypothetical protein